MLLVTGITGHSGRYFLKELIEHKYDGEIRCLVRATSDTSLLDSSGLKIEKRIGNLDDPEFIDQAMVGIDTVMHIYNIHHSPSIVQFAIAHQVKRVILVHTTGIYSKFKQASYEYQELEKKVLKLETDNNSNTKIVILRPTMIYGDLCDHNMSKFIKIVDKLKIMPVINHGKSILQPVNARDLGKAFYTVLMMTAENLKAAYNLSGDRPIRMLEVLQTISKELKRKTVFVNVPLKLGVVLTRVIKAFSFGKLDLIEKIQRMGEDRSCPHEDATRDFDYQPMTFAEGIKTEVQKYKIKK